MRAALSRPVLRTAALAAGLFGVLTIGAGGRVLFGDGAAAAGQVVPFVLWFNFLAGFAYVVAAAGLWRAARWGAWTALAIAGASALVFALFGLHVATGGAFEMRTVWAMTLRTAVWAAIAAIAFRSAAAAAAASRSRRAGSSPPGRARCRR